MSSDVQTIRRSWLAIISSDKQQENHRNFQFTRQERNQNREEFWSEVENEKSSWISSRQGHVGGKNCETPSKGRVRDEKKNLGFKQDHEEYWIKNLSINGFGRNYAIKEFPIKFLFQS